MMLDQVTHLFQDDGQSNKRARPVAVHIQSSTIAKRVIA
jgi:hypothetical protein